MVRPWRTRATTRSSVGVRLAQPLAGRPRAPRLPRAWPTASVRLSRAPSAAASANARAPSRSVERCSRSATTSTGADVPCRGGRRRRRWTESRAASRSGPRAAFEAASPSRRDRRRHEAVDGQRQRFVQQRLRPHRVLGQRGQPRDPQLLGDQPQVVDQAGDLDRRLGGPARLARIGAVEAAGRRTTTANGSGPARPILGAAGRRPRGCAVVDADLPIASWARAGSCAAPCLEVGEASSISVQASRRGRAARLSAWVVASAARMVGSPRATAAPIACSYH